MKNKLQLIAAAFWWVCGFVVGMIFLGLSRLSSEIEWLETTFTVLATIAFLIPAPMSLWAFCYSFWQFYKMGKKDNVAERKRRIHYTLPLAFPVAVAGFSPISIVLAIVWFYAIYKWARPHYSKAEMKAVLMHRNGVSWGRTLLSWVNALFFVFSTIIPLIMLALILWIFDAVTSGSRGGSSSGSGSGSGSSGDSFRCCSNCAYYSGGSECPYTHSHMDPSDSCSNFKHHMSS